MLPARHARHRTVRASLDAVRLVPVRTGLLRPIHGPESASRHPGGQTAHVVDDAVAGDVAKSKDAKTALNDAVKRGNEILRQFEAANK